MSNTSSRAVPILTIVAFCFLGFVLFFRLTESPATWMDEGAIDQVAINLAQSGVYGYQIAPRHFISAEFLTTGYPVVYPVVLSFLLFGKSLFSARIVMVLFLFLLAALSYWYSRMHDKNGELQPLLPVFSLLLLITFAPLYGHGKNVLGEVPGFTFFLSSLLLLMLFERGYRPWWLSSVIGVLLGLSMATKPLYLVLILPPALFVIFLLKRKVFSLKEKILCVVGMFLPLMWWVIVQSGGGSFLSIFLYGNPNSTSLLTLLRGNSVRFFSESQPIYCLVLVLFWWAGSVIRERKGILISAAESIALIFSVLNLLSFLTTRGFYRYLFPVEVLALLFLPHALYSIIRLKWDPRRAFQYSIALLVVLIGMQSYQLFFHSWISESRISARAAILTQELGALSPRQSIFFYHVPEAIIFLPHNNYYQYLKFADTVERGKEFLPLLTQGKVDYLLVDVRFSTSSPLLALYKEKSHFDKYTLYEKK